MSKVLFVGGFVELDHMTRDARIAMELIAKQLS